jgi:hypothetical protein
MSHVRPQHFLLPLLLLVLTGVAFAAPAPPTVPIPYTLPQAGRVSLLIADAQGQVVRELLHAAPRPAGQQTEPWDGLDALGQPAPAGVYTWKLLLSDGLKAEYLMSLGTTAVPPWKQLPGNHNGVSSVAVDEAGMVYLSAGCSEGPPQIVKQSVDGRTRAWDAGHVFDAWQGATSATVLGEKLYAMQPGGVVMVIDGATGKRAARWELWWDKDDKGEPPFGMLGLIDLAGRGTTLVMAHKVHDALRWIDPATGKVLDEAAVPAPQAVAVAADGRVYVLSQEGVVTLTRAEKTPAPVIPAGTLTAAYRLEVCPATGDLFIAERGESQQVKRYTRDGKLLQTLGRKGGRQQGAYDPTDFRTVFDITADGAGGFFICEAWDAPRRTARFNREGKLVSDWFGGQMYANHAVADPADPTLWWVDSHFGSIIKAKVDYQTKTWKILATYTFGGMTDGFIPSTTHGGGRFVVRHHDGQTYLCRDDVPVVLREDAANRRLVPLVASQYSIWHAWRTGYLPAFVKELLQPDPAMRAKAQEAQPFARDPEKQAWLWTDTNADAKPQADEIRFGQFPSWFASRWYVDDGLNYARYCSILNEEGVLESMPVREWTTAGVPVYTGWSDRQPVPAAMPAWLRATKGDYGARGRIGCVGIWPDGAGGWFSAFNDGNKPYGMGYLSAKAGANRVVRWDAAGKLLWDVGLHSPNLGAKPGEARSFFRTAGVAHGCVAITDYECYYEIKNLVHVWDRDGLWVGRLLETPDLKVAPQEAYTLCTENFGGALIEITPAMKVPGLKTGDVLFAGSAQNDTRLYRITGWETMRRQTGTVRISPDFAAGATAVATREATRPGVARIGRVNFSAVDAELKKWQGTTPLLIRNGDKDVAKLYLGWNPSGLFACFDVTTDHPWKSKSSAQEAFTGGAAVDVNLGPLLPAERKAPVVGDARYVAAPVGRDTLVEYLPFLLPELRGKKPITFETAVNGKVLFEHFQAYPATPKVVACKLKPDDGGYVVELQLPLRTPLTPAPGCRFKLEASVILADEDGRSSEARLPWHSRSPDDQLVTADQVIEATLRPANWGEAVLE